MKELDLQVEYKEESILVLNKIKSFRSLINKKLKHLDIPDESIRRDSNLVKQNFSQLNANFTSVHPDDPITS